MQGRRQRGETSLPGGAFYEGIDAMGGPRRSKGESIEALEEAVQIIHAFWSSNRSPRFEGKYHTVKGSRPRPYPAHPIGLWLGFYGPRSLALTGQLADGWLPSSSYAPPERLPQMQQRISDAALSAGCQPQDIRRIYRCIRKQIGRERQIAFCVARGQKNKDISAQLNISENTVKRHLQSIFNKTGARDRLELAVLALNEVSRAAA